MAIQILGLRPKADGKLEDYSIFDKYKIEAPSVTAILENPDEYLKHIPQSEHWNLFFTIAQCGIKKRSFESLEVMPFDFDGIDTAQLDAYIEVFCKTLGVKREETGIVASGNGLHFYVGLEVPIVDAKFFKQNRHHYKAILEAITKAVKARDLPIGKVDPAVFDAARILRMPNTTNKKEGRSDSRCAVLQPKIIPIAFDITLASGIPTVKPEESIPKEYLRKYPKTDNKAILSGCDFLKFCQESPNEITEPQWYAMLSITSRMVDGNTLSHNISKGHRGYSFEQTESKIEHALNASPPRKCSSINALWGKCRGCPNFEKIESPIMLKSEDRIATEDTGFHTVVLNPDTGKMGKPIPNYADLRKFFERSHHYVAHSKLCFVWHATHYELYESALLENFAQRHFNPYAHTGMTAEFKNLVLRTNVVRPIEWSESTKRKINFKNGILHLDTMDFLPHDKSLGFRYCLPYDYDPKAQAPRFEKFLREIMLGDESLCQILLEFGGYALSGDDCKGAKALFLLGEGSNGKSTYVKVLKALAGRSNYQTISLKDFSNMERRHALDGALFNIAEETPDRVADSNDFKNLVDGGELKVRKLFSDDYTIENRAKLIFTCNSLPSSYDSTLGYRRRLLIVPFDAQFSESNGNEDKDLDTKLFSELAGIFNLMVAAYRKFVANGKKFTQSTKAMETLEKYDVDNDPIKEWIHGSVEILPKTDPRFESMEINTTRLHKSYIDFCDETRVDKRKVLSLSWFGRRLRYIIPEYDARFKRAKYANFIKGVQLINEGPSY
jgi:putative DNA primase/helicase